MFGRKVLGLAVAAAMVLGVFAAPAMADTSASAYKHVYVIVESNITLGGGSAAGGNGGSSTGDNGGTDEIEMVPLGSVQTGMFAGDICWDVDANTEALRFYVQVSALYKGDDPTNAEVAPIPLYLDAGVTFSAPNANPALGNSATQALSPNPVTSYDGFPVYQSDALTMESSQNNKFSQELKTRIYWNQDDPEKPKGQYSGIVCLMAFTVDSL